ILGQGDFRFAAHGCAPAVVSLSCTATSQASWAGTVVQPCASQMEAYSACASVSTTTWAAHQAASASASTSPLSLACSYPTSSGGGTSASRSLCMPALTSGSTLSSTLAQACDAALVGCGPATCVTAGA